MLFRTYFHIDLIIILQQILASGMGLRKFFTHEVLLAVMEWVI